MGCDRDDRARSEQQYCVCIVRSDKEIWNKGSDYYVRPGQASDIKKFITFGNDLLMFKIVY